jgi:hypothetical protein
MEPTNGLLPAAQHPGERMEPTKSEVVL